VTLCVAAECRRYKGFFSAVVFATDFQVEGQTARADIGVKVAEIGQEFYPILLAGTQTRAVELACEINTVVHKTASPLGHDYVPPAWSTILNEAILRQKHRIANEIIVGRFGISYDELLKIGREHFPPDVYRDTISEISRTSLDCWLLVIAFSQPQPTIFRISDSGMVETCQNFAAIGSGLYLAESVLFQRNQHTNNDLGTTIYNVFEAMRLGSRAPGVGDRFEITIAEWEYWHEVSTNEGWVKWSHLSPAYYSYLEKRFQRYGPKQCEAIKLRPRLIDAVKRSVVLTPKGMADPEVIARSKRAKVARKREAKKRKAKERSDHPKGSGDKNNE